jgi:hypothetical protein
VTVAVVGVTATTAVLVVGGCVWTRTTLDQGDEALVSLVGDLARVSQLEVAAERMVAMGRGYVLTREPELLARAQAAEAKLELALPAVARGPQGALDGGLRERLLDSADRYRALFQNLVVSPPAKGAPEADGVLRERLLPARDAFESNVEALAFHDQDRVSVLRAAKRDVAWRIVRFMAPIGLLGIVASCVVAWIAIVQLRRLSQLSAVLTPPEKEERGSPANPTGGSQPSAPEVEPSEADADELERPQKPRTEEPRWWPAP